MWEGRSLWPHFLLIRRGLEIKEAVENVHRYSIGSVPLFFVTLKNLANFVVHTIFIYLCSKSRLLVNALNHLILLFIAFSYAEYLFMDTQ
jgi:hypothetical protein